MDVDSMIRELLTLADETIEMGPGDGRGMRMAALVHRLADANVLRGTRRLRPPPIPSRK